MSQFQGRGQRHKKVVHCHCKEEAIDFETKKECPNKGRWFYKCSKSSNDPTRCTFWTWEDEVQGIESETPPSNAKIKLEPSERPEPSRKRRRSADEQDGDESGASQAGEHIQHSTPTQFETPRPRHAANNSEYTTPSTARRTLWGNDQAIFSSAQGLHTPYTNRGVHENPFGSTSAGPSNIPFTTPFASQDNNGIVQTPTPSSSFEAATPSRSRNVATEDLVPGVFKILNDADVGLPPSREKELQNFLTKHANNAKGYQRRLDVSQMTINAKKSKILELEYRINTLNEELKVEQAKVELLESEAQEHGSDV